MQLNERALPERESANDAVFEPGIEAGFGLFQGFLVVDLEKLVAGWRRSLPLQYQESGRGQNSPKLMSHSVQGHYENGQLWRLQPKLYHLVAFPQVG